VVLSDIGTVLMEEEDASVRFGFGGSTGASTGAVLVDCFSCQW